MNKLEGVKVNDEFVYGLDGSLISRSRLKHEAGMFPEISEDMKKTSKSINMQNGVVMVFGTGGEDNFRGKYFKNLWDIIDVSK